MKEDRLPLCPPGRSWQAEAIVSLVDEYRETQEVGPVCAILSICPLARKLPRLPVAILPCRATDRLITPTSAATEDPEKGDSSLCRSS